MSSKTAAEFDAAYFRQLFGSDDTSWAEFVSVSIHSFAEAKADLCSAAASGDMDSASKIRHAIGPSLTQWGAVTLESSLRALDADNLAEDWAPLEAEFDALIAALKAL
jgi:hypothetical protein